MKKELLRMIEKVDSEDLREALRTVYDHLGRQSNNQNETIWSISSDKYEGLGIFLGLQEF